MDSLPVERRKGILVELTRVLAFINYQWICANPGTPKLYDIGARYRFKKRPMALDSWWDLPTVYEQKAGDCKDFVAIRLAELARDGITQAAPYVSHKLYTDPRTKQSIEVFHVQIMCGPDIEDPSRILGMPDRVPFATLSQIFK